MDGLFQDIYAIYSVQADLLGCFAELSEKKSEYIKNNEVGKLNQLIRAEEALLMKFSFMESKRQKALEMLRIEQEVEGDLDISVLERHLDREELEKFNEVSERLYAAIREQKENNDFNKRLLASRINYIDYILNVIDKKQTGDVELEQSNIIDRRI